MGKDRKDKHTGVGEVVENLASFKTKDALREEDIQLTRELTALEQRYKEIYQAVARLSATYSDCKEHNAISRYGDLKEMIKACVTDEVMEKIGQCCNDVMQHESKGKAASMLAASRKLSQISRVAAEKENVASESVKNLGKCYFIMEKIGQCCNEVIQHESKGKAASMLAASRKLSQISRVAAEKENVASKSVKNLGKCYFIMEKIGQCCNDVMQHESKGKAASMLAASRKLSQISRVAAEKENEIHQLHKAEIVKDIEDKQKAKSKLERNFLRLRNRLEKLKRDYEDSKQYIPTKRYLVMKEMIKPMIRDEALKADV